MEKKNILIVSSHQELQEIERKHPFLIHADLILLTGNFPIEEINCLSKKRSIVYFDEMITKQDSIKYLEYLNNILWSWFLDKDGNDLSLINGCSLGSAFVSSIEVVCVTTIRYITGMEKLLNKDMNVFYNKFSEENLLNALSFLDKKIGFNSKEIKIDLLSNDLNFILRKRNFNKVFKGYELIRNLTYFILKKFQRVHEQPNKVLFMPAGKHDSFFTYVKKSRKLSNITWVLPLQKMSDFKGLRDESTCLYYQFPTSRCKSSKKVDDTIFKLKNNIKTLRELDDFFPFEKILISNIFPYFSRALDYFYNCKKTFYNLNLDLVMLSADSHESFILAAQAAKEVGIKTAHIPHGLYGWGYDKYKAGRFKVIDYGLSFGSVDVDNYLNSGMDKRNIFITPFPYFDKFLPVSDKNRVEKYTKVLILAPDIMNNIPHYKISNEVIYYNNVCLMLNEIGIDVIGIKARDMNHFSNLGIAGDNIVVNNKKIPLIGEYLSFSEAAECADVVIGPSSTAAIEAALLGKDYYVYQSIAIHKFTNSSLPAIYDYINASYSVQQLKENIKRRKNFKSNYSVNDLLDLDGIHNKRDLYSRFESGVLAALKTI